jgi:nucleotide sugar dehydrogenase
MAGIGNKKIAVIGLGVVGSEVFKELKKRGISVTGIDIDEKKASELGGKDGIDSCYDIYVICVYSTKQVLEVINSIDYSNCPLIIIESTLIPGSEKEIKEIIVEKNNSNLVICPHRFNPGDPEHHVFNLKRVIAGATEKCLQKGLDFYYSFMKKDDLVQTSLECAVLSKIVENAYRYVEIAVAEEIKLFCDKLGYDFNEIRRCVNSKWNINLKEARDGIKGTCLPKETEILNNYFKANLLFNAARQVDANYVSAVNSSVKNRKIQPRR